MIPLAVTLLLVVAAVAPVGAAANETATPLAARIDELAAELESKVIEWRRDIHEHPELSNREVRTGALVAEHLRRLGIEVRDKVAHTGVVGVLVGGLPGKVVALRADLDGLPVVERTDLPFASRVTSDYNGSTVGVMHACGHDAHVAILMGVAELLSEVRESIPGTVKFLFQPAEEGPPAGERGGASLMVEEGALENPRPEAIFGLHVTSRAPTGIISYRPGGVMASADGLSITVRGRQTHGAMPWLGVDPITISGHILVALQSIPSRQLDVTASPAVVSIGSIHGGVRGNIIPDEVVMVGTVRSLDPDIRTEFHERIKHTVKAIAESMGATAEVDIRLGAPVTYNDPQLTERMLPTLRRVAGAERVVLASPTTGAEDFSIYQETVPGLFVFLGVTPPGTDPKEAAPNHSPLFRVDEDGLIVGVKTMAALAVDFLAGEQLAGQ